MEKVDTYRCFFRYIYDFQYNTKRHPIKKSGCHIDSKNRYWSTSQGFHLCLKLFTVAQGSVFDTCTVVVDGVHRVMKELRYL